MTMSEWDPLDIDKFDGRRLAFICDSSRFTWRDREILYALKWIPEICAFMHDSARVMESYYWTRYHDFRQFAFTRKLPGYEA